jgi:hypothetical protein
VGQGCIAGDCFWPSAEKEILPNPTQRAINFHRLFVLTALRFIEYNRQMDVARKSKLKGKTVNVQPWFCEDCVRYGAVGLVAAAGGGSESPINDIRASHRALSPKCAARHVTICALETLHLGDWARACLQQGNDPKSGYARTWASQTALVSAGVACGATVIAAKDNAESPFRIYGPGSNMADHWLLEVTGTGELIIAGGTGSGYRLAELMGASNPSGWSGVLKVKTPAGATAGYIL